ALPLIIALNRFAQVSSASRFSPAKSYCTETPSVTPRPLKSQNDTPKINICHSWIAAKGRPLAGTSGHLITHAAPQRVALARIQARVSYDPPGHAVLKFRADNDCLACRSPQQHITPEQCKTARNGLRNVEAL